MNNKEIAKKFQLLGKIMELHGENQFKTRSYANAYITIKKWPQELSELATKDLASIPGIGKAISEKVNELLSTGNIQTLNKYIDQTPAGIVDMLQIRGFGPKKVLTIWKDLEIESIGELLYAVNENRLVELKGFGLKTQEALKHQLIYHIESEHKIHYAFVEHLAQEIIELLKAKFPDYLVELSGAIYRKDQVIDCITLVTTIEPGALNDYLNTLENIGISNDKLSFHNIELEIIHSTSENFYYDWVRSSCGNQFWNKLSIPKKNYISEHAVFEDNQLPYFIPEFREDDNTLLISEYKGSDAIVTMNDIKGCIHNHSTYSDGLNSISEMLEASAKLGHEYFVLTDHSRSAFYANGLTIERLYQQLEEIRTIDQAHSNIRLFSGIESDILTNGDLDYPDDVLAELDIVIASIHSNLQMDEVKATQRLINAVENPYTSILGHPTGRLLLSRKGYPIDHKKIIDACAVNNVAIEINANPNRLDIDWTWINYAMEKDILIAINPDAHSIKGIEDIYFGVCSARKAALRRSLCLNAFDTEEFEEWLEEQHEKR